MDDTELANFANFLKTITKKNGKKIGEKTIHGVLVLAKFCESSKNGEKLENLSKRYQDYLTKRNYPMAKYALWLYLRSVGYEDKFIKEIINFKKMNQTALNDGEKLAESVLTNKELIYLVDNIELKRDKLIVKLLYDTAGRISEIMNIKLKDIDFKTREVEVMGKGRKPRTVYIQQSSANMLREYLDENKIINPNMPVFNIKPITVWYNLKKYGKELLSRDLHPHMLRHSRLQHMADEGVDSFAIKSYAGHSDISTTQIYVKSSKFQGKIAFDKAGDVWDKKKKDEQRKLNF